MKIKGQLSGKIECYTPEKTKERVTLLTTCILNSTECQAVSLAFIAIDRAIFPGNIPAIPDIHVNIIFYCEDEIVFEMDDLGFGFFGNMILLPVHRWRSERHCVERIAYTIIEELCHCFFNIRDEVAVKEKTVELLRSVGVSMAWSLPYQLVSEKSENHPN